MYTIRELLFYISVLFIALVLMLFARPLYAANDLEKWNSEVGRTVRQSHSDKLAQTTYREMDSRNVTVSKDMKTVYPQIETRSQVAGSRTRVVAEAVLEVDKDKVWKDWNKKLNKFGKGTAAGVAGSVIVGYILDGVGWIIDEGGKVTKKPNPNDAPDLNYQYKSSRTGTLYENAESLGRADFAKVLPPPWVYTETKVAGNGAVSVHGHNPDTNRDTGYQVGSRVARTTPPKTPEPQEVSEEEKEQVLKDLLNNPKYADLAAQMIGNTYSMGPDNPEPDPDVVNDLKNKQKDVLKSDNPKGDGKTRIDPKIDTGTEIKSDSTTNTESTTNVNETTTTNPDGSTTTTGTNVTNNTTITNNTTEIPPFCDFAAILCDWIGWTKEEPELVDDKLEIQERDVTDYKYEDHIKFGQSCPFSEKTQNLDMGVGVMKVKYNLDFFCDFSREAKPTIVGIGHLGALIFLLIGIRSGASG